MNRVTEIRPWGDIARKVIAAALGGITASGILWLAATLGVEIPEGVAGLIATGIATLAGYFTPGTVPVGDDVRQIDTPATNS